MSARKLTSVDGAFLYLETPETPMHVGSMAIFKLPEGYRGDFFEDFKAQIASRLHLAPMLTWKLARMPLDLDNPSWVEDEQFDLDRHLFRGALPAPHDRTTLERLVGWMHAKLLNRARPLWEFYVFEGLPNNEIGLYSKVHHALIDGGAGAALTEIVYGDGQISAPPAAKPAAPDALGQVGELFAGYASLWSDPLGLQPALKSQAAMLGGRAPDLGAALRDMWMQQLQQPLTFLKGLPDIAKAIGGIAAKFAEPGAVKSLGDMMAPSTSLNKQISSERSFAGVSVSLSRAKAVATAAGGKLNDVVLAISSGMLRRYLEATDQLPAKSLKAAVPISLREAGDSAANNQVFGMYCSLASDIADPKTRLAKIIEETKTAKSQVDPFKPLVPKLTQFSALGAPMLIQMLSLLYSRTNLSDHLPVPANVTISNVPGSRKALYAAGAELIHIFPVSIATHSLALNITVQGYRDQLDFGLIAGANVLPELHSLAMMLPQELETLERAYGLGPAQKEMAPTQTAKPQKAPVKTTAPGAKKPRARARA
jgi:WS/DGAT/MGAT family acyltransferase